MGPRIYTSPYPSIPVVSHSIFSHILSLNSSNNTVGRFSAQADAFVDSTTGTAITRQELRSLALKFGYGLTQDPRIKAKRGDTILVYSPNSLAYPVFLLGAIAAGLRCTLANNAYIPRELAHQYTDSGANMIITTLESLDIVLETLKGLGMSHADAKKRLIVVTQSLAWAGGPTVHEGTQSLITFEQLLSLGELREDERFDGEAAQETVLLCYSSGTTGLPKGVQTTHQNLTSEVNAITPVFRFEEGDKLLVFLPFYHIYGVVTGIFFSLFCGSTTVVMSGFDPVQFCKVVEKYSITAVLVVPPVMMALARHPAMDNYNLSSIRLLFCSAAPLSPELTKQALKRLLAKRKPEQPLYISEGYGMTECSPACHMLPIDSMISKMGSVGVLLPNFQARLIEDDSGEVVIDAAEGKPGELWLRGPSVMKGYLNNPTANKNSLTVDRWYKTGDICLRDSDGFYRIIDRKKELIKYKGFQVPPAELESVLLTHPEVADAAVIGIYSDDDATELPRAYVVHPKPSEIPTDESKKAYEKSVNQWMQSKVARHKYLRGGVVAITEVPRSAAGKILRNKLRELSGKDLMKSKL